MFHAVPTKWKQSAQCRFISPVAGAKRKGLHASGIRWNPVVFAGGNSSPIMRNLSGDMSGPLARAASTTARREERKSHRNLCRSADELAWSPDSKDNYFTRKNERREAGICDGGALWREPKKIIANTFTRHFIHADGKRGFCADEPDDACRISRCVRRSNSAGNYASK